MQIKVMGRLQGTDEWVAVDEDSHGDNEEVPGALMLVHAATVDSMTDGLAEREYGET